jgi:predicted nucleic acid-binding protein
MLIVVDANVIFSALLSKDSKAFDIFAVNRIFGVFEFVAPEYLFYEIDKRRDKIMSLTKLSKKELEDIFSFLKGEIEFVSMDEFKDKSHEAKQLVQHEKDAPYIALALKLICPVLSGDKGLKKQSKVKILSPSDALSILYVLNNNLEE